MLICLRVYIIGEVYENPIFENLKYTRSFGAKAPV